MWFPAAAVVVLLAAPASAKPVADARRAAALTETARQWARAKHHPLQVDRTLTRIAGAAFKQLTAPVGSDFGVLRTLAWQHGWRDAGLIALEVDAKISPRDLKALLDRTAGNANRMGIATQAHRAVILLATKHVQLDRVAARQRRSGNIAIGGKLTGQAQAIWGVVGLPNGLVQQLAITRNGRRFDTRVAAAATGRYEIQLFLDRGRGPEIAAHFPIGVAASPWDAPKVALPEVPETEPEARLRALIEAWREKQGITRLQNVPALAEAARRHAEDMRDHNFFGHASPTAGDARQRLRRLGVGFERVTENLAQVSGEDPAARAVERWIDSPAHRANLLDGAVQAFGVAVVATPSGERLVVAVFARLTKS